MSQDLFVNIGEKLFHQEVSVEIIKNKEHKQRQKILSTCWQQ